MGTELHTPTIPPAALPRIERELESARHVLRDLWWKASPADRIFAVDRLLREDSLPPALQAGLQRVQDAVRDAWATARIASALDDGVPADGLLAGLQLNLAERDRDNFLEDHRLFDGLFAAAEGYLRQVPLVAGGSFRELMHQRDWLRAKLVPILPPVDDAR